MGRSDDPKTLPLRLSPAALGAAVLLLAGRLDPARLSSAFSREVAELEAIGVVHDGELAPWVVQPLLMILAPDLHVEAIVATAASSAITQIWARPDAAVVGHTDSAGRLELASTAPRSLAWMLRTAVGLGVRAGPPVSLRGPIDPVRLAHFENAVAVGDHERADVLLNGGQGFSTDELAAMASLASPDRRTWRVTANWTAAAGPAQRWMSVVDGGSSGLWFSQGATLQGAPASDEAAALVPASITDVWQCLIAVLPPGTSDAPDAPDASDASHADDRSHPRRTPCPQPVPPIQTASCDSSPPPSTSIPA